MPDETENDPTEANKNSDEEENENENGRASRGETTRPVTSERDTTAPATLFL